VNDAASDLQIAPYRTQQVNRLSRVVDVVFGLMLFQLFLLLPRPNEAEEAEVTVFQVIAAEWEIAVVMLLGTAIIAILWHQNNILLGSLRATDGIHTALILFQLVSIEMLLYSIGLGIRVGASEWSRVLESGMTAFSSGLAYASWFYAARKGFLSAALSDLEAAQIAERNKAEPLTALLTLPFAFIGTWLWEASWFLYPAIKHWFKARARRMESVSDLDPMGL
jgi:hypothetical protein